VDFTTKVTQAEQESLLILSFELETSVANFKKGRARLKALERDLASFIPPKVKRTMYRRAKRLLQATKVKSNLLETMAAVETSYAKEEAVCIRDSSHGRTKLREYRGELALLRKRVELADAQIAFGNALGDAIGDGLLVEKERIYLTKYSTTFSQLKHTVDGITCERH